MASFVEFWSILIGCWFVVTNELIGSRSDGEEWFREEHIFQGEHFQTVFQHEFICYLKIFETNRKRMSISCISG